MQGSKHRNKLEPRKKMGDIEYDDKCHLSCKRKGATCCLPPNFGRTIGVRSWMFCVGCTQTRGTNQTHTNSQPSTPAMSQAQGTLSYSDPTMYSLHWSPQGALPGRGLGLTGQHWRGLAGRWITQKHKLEFKAEFVHEAELHDSAAAEPRAGKWTWGLFLFWISSF